MERHLSIFRIAFESVWVNKLRGFLTALGIIFGVAAVIAMLAIGSGAKKFILDQMRLIGTNNIVFEYQSLEEAGSNEQAEPAGATNAGDQSSNQLKPWAPGFNMDDLDVISATVPGIDAMSPEIIHRTKAIYAGRLIDTRCVGVTNTFFELNQLSLAKGTFFTPEHVRQKKAVCVIGQSIATKLFSGKDALGETVKCGNSHFTVVGILQQRVATRETLSALGLRDFNSDIFIPIDVSLLWFGDRARISKDDVNPNRRDWDESEQFHQIDRLVVRVAASQYLEPTADVIARTLKRLHHDQVDFTVEIPELLLQQEQKTQDIFNLVLAVIAGISLLVGGIGIMNIMLASVFERIKEIGVRRAMGATRQDIVYQFLFEAMFVSIIGGVVGIFLGIAAARIIATAAEIPTLISGWSIALSFGVAASIGLIFGIYPAQKAARLDPINALRTE